MISYVKGRVKSFRYAFMGIGYLIRSEANFRIHLVSAVIAIGVFYLLGISYFEWLIVSLSISFVLVSEAINTAIERLSENAKKGYSDTVKIVKDVSAGASLISAMNAIIVGVVIVVKNF